MKKGYSIGVFHGVYNNHVFVESRLIASQEAFAALVGMVAGSVMPQWLHDLRPADHYV